MSPWQVIFRREFRAYFATPLAAVFLVVFLFMAGVFSFSMGGLFERGQADLRSFFSSFRGSFSFSRLRFRCDSGRKSDDLARSKFLQHCQFHSGMQLLASFLRRGFFIGRTRVDSATLVYSLLAGRSRSRRHCGGIHRIGDGRRNLSGHRWICFCTDEKSSDRIRGDDRRMFSRAAFGIPARAEFLSRLDVYWRS